MTAEPGLRIAVGAVFLALISVQFVYHRLAGREGNIEEMKRKPLQSTVIAAMGLLSMSLVAVFVVWGGEPIGWASLDLPEVLRWTGVPIAACGLYLFFWTHKVLGRNFSPTTRIQDEQELIVSGPYRYVQHPMYSAFLLFAVAFFLTTANWIVGISWLFGVFLLLFVRLRHEEEGLRERFGEAYREYSSHTARIVPGVW